MTAPEPQTDRFEPTIAAVAVRVGVNARTVAAWLAAGAPGKTDLGYDVDGIEDWRGLHIRSSSVAASDPEMGEWKVRRLVAQTRIAESNALLREHEAETTTEDVCRLDEVEQFLRGLSAGFDRQLSSVPERMLNRLPAAVSDEYREQVQSEITDNLELVRKSFKGYCERVKELRGI